MSPIAPLTSRILSDRNLVHRLVSETTKVSVWCSSSMESESSRTACVVSGYDTTVSNSEAVVRREKNIMKKCWYKEMASVISKMILMSKNVLIAKLFPNSHHCHDE